MVRTRIRSVHGFREPASTNLPRHSIGKTDYVFVEGNNGSLRAWLNKGPSAWAAVNDGNEIVWGIGADTTPIVLLADLDGDGRDDYIG